jgi:tetratricopeptide (TPR) repeat protein
MTIKQAMIVIILSGLRVFGFGTDFSFAQQSRTDIQISYYQELLKRNSQNAKAYYGLGDAMIRKARETGDSTYFNRAEDALKKSLEIAPHNGSVMRHLAYVFYSRHEFEAAAMHARKAVQMNPRDGDSHGVLGDALLEVGQYAEAEMAYRQMMTLKRSLYSYSRLAGLKSTRGDVAGSMFDLKTAIAIGKLTKEPAESIAWVEWQLGSDYFSQGNLAEAESYYQQALKTYPGYYRALAGLAQTRAAQQRHAEAVELYQKAIGIVPMPEYIAALGDLYTKAGKLDDARKQYELVEYIGKLSALNQAMYNRELAYFYADHDVKLAEGLTLAERELEYRRDIYAHDVLAWNLYKSGRLDQARAAIDQALRLGTQDAKLFYHAGMIFNQLGDKEKAKDYFRRALSTNPHFHILFAERASRVLREIDNSDASAMVSQGS